MSRTRIIITAAVDVETTRYTEIEQRHNAIDWITEGLKFISENALVSEISGDYYHVEVHTEPLDEIEGDGKE